MREDLAIATLVNCVNRHISDKRKDTQGQLVVDLDKLHAHWVDGLALVLAHDALGKLGLLFFVGKLDRLVQHPGVHPAPLREKFPVQRLPGVFRLRVIDTLSFFILEVHDELSI